MVPLVLEGTTLGEKHQHYNTLVKSATINQMLSLENINYADNDIDNLLKIDVACNRRDVDYILDVLTCDDMLYISRAISRSTWLITEHQYAHIINPQYLHDNLFPNMCSKAKHKLLLKIRLKLKEQHRVDEFFYYFFDHYDFKFAMKWLPGCSLDVIEKCINEHASEIDMAIIKNICDKSINIFRMYCQHMASDHCTTQLIKNCTSIVKKHTEEILDIFESTIVKQQSEDIFDILECLNFNNENLGKKVTRIFLNQCPHRIINNFHKFCYYIDMDTFAESMKTKDIQSFLLKQKENEDLEDWFVFENIKHFIKYLPKDKGFEFVKALCPPTEYNRNGYNHTNAPLYNSYRYATFSTAFDALTKFIHIETNPSERTAILIVLLNCARSNEQYIYKDFTRILSRKTHE